MPNAKPEEGPAVWLRYVVIAGGVEQKITQRVDLTLTTTRLAGRRWW